MFINSTFNYDGIDSSTFGLSVVRVQQGMTEMPFGVNRTIVEEKAKNNPIPYFFGVEKQALTLTLTLYKEGVWDYETRKQVVQWLFKDEYKALITPDTPQVVYYAMPEGDSRRFDNSLNEGYITINFRCNAPYAFSQLSTITHDLSANVSTSHITLANQSNIEQFIYPEMEVTLMGDATSFSFKNINDNNNTLSFTGLQTGETIYINNSRKQIISSNKNFFRYDNFNRKWLRLAYGDNDIEITGKVKVVFKLQYPIAL